MVLLLPVVSCNKHEYPREGPFNIKKSFIPEYRIPHKLECLPTAEKTSPTGSLFTVTGDNISYGQMYDALCEKNGDMSYYRNHVSTPIWALSQDVQSISLIAYEDFDAAHQSMSDVAECVDISFYTLAAFIANGYKKDESRAGGNDPFKYCSESSGHIIYSMRMNEVNAKNSHLCGSEFYMKFAKQPTVKGPHRFKLIMRFEDCTLEKECTFNFE